VKKISFMRRKVCIIASGFGDPQVSGDPTKLGSVDIRGISN
jgi:hypothetical protein